MRKLLSLVAVVAVCSLASAACTAGGDDDDDGFTGNTNTPTPTPTGTPTGTPTPAATPQLPTPISSFITAGGAEIWLCLESRFAGSIDNVALSTQCTDTKVGLAIQSTLEVPHYHAIRLDDDGAGLACDNGMHHWVLDYKMSTDRCEGCVNATAAFDIAADDNFGTFCGPGGTPPISTIDAYFADTTQKLRFLVDVIPTAPKVKINSLRLYDADVFVAECTSPATINSGGDGLFDVDCTPAVTGATFIEGNTYDAFVNATVNDNITFLGLYPWDYGAAP